MYSKITYHIVPEAYYLAQPADQAYQPEPMAQGKEDFIHCTDGLQNLAVTGNRFYKNDLRPFLVLFIDLQKLTAPSLYEDEKQIFPHIYGKLNRSAIIKVGKMPRAADGTFLLPEEQ
jgi:glutathione S-transferase